MATAKGGKPAPRRSSSFIPSCFRGSLVSDNDSDDAEDRPVSGGRSSRLRTSWFLSCSRFRWKKKTVPFDASPESAVKPVGGRIGLAEIQTKITVELPPPKRPLSKGRKDKDKSSRTGTKYSHHQAPPPAAAAVHANTVPKKSPCIYRISACTQPAPIHRMRDPAKTETATIHPSPTKRHQPAAGAAAATSRPLWKKCEGLAGELDPDAGLLVVAVSLAMLLLFGRAGAVVCMSAWFYLLPRLRAASPATAAVAVKDSAAKKGSREAVDGDGDFQEYKKRVVLQGLLERNGRRPSGFLAAAAPVGAR